jgi:plastocyanin
MLRPRSSIPGLIVVAITVLAVGVPASAQTDCITPNCVFAGTPAICANRATPQTPTVQLGSGLQTIFVPADPRIEPGDCIVWRAASNTHSSSGASCDPDPFCGSPSPSACEWDSANLSSDDPTPTSTCYYDPALFPPESADDFHCRIHAQMLGTLQVTTPIVLTLGKDVGTSSVKLNWTGGGVTGDASYKVARQSGGNPRFPVGATTTTVNPDGGVLGTTFTDTGALGSTTSRYYLVRNKQTSEP